MYVAAVAELDDVELAAAAIGDVEVASKADRLVGVVDQLLFNLQFATLVQPCPRFEPDMAQAHVHLPE